LKRKQRLDYANLAEVLRQRNLVDRRRLSLALQTSSQSAIPFPEVLVTDGLIGDFDLARVVSDLYSLPFLPVTVCSPHLEAMAGLDEAFLRQHRLIPLDRFGSLLTVCMPAIVPADVLGTLAASNNIQVLPVVGTVNTNNKWLEEHLTSEVPGALPNASPTDWSNIFDEGNAAVLMELTGEEDQEDHNGEDPAAFMDPLADSLPRVED
jgi:hypothetical protein